ncbi:Class III chitinase [Lachnellula hyalina]|uniref:chitinase n=1 Tax=Lachnellula hyalina TaxID=1316788 RepID=A0A8H8U0D2_9HELO|nr:Class III chitinase [Lachnellula hyalina]TVY28767.1 Class III chitinase [Lachnellula hyalina]
MEAYLRGLCLTSLLAFMPLAYAGFSSSSSSNLAVYWGQNSYGQGTGTLAQQRLSYYCATLIFIPVLNKSREDIATCQSTYGKTILLSVGGSTYTEGGFTSEDAAVAAASNLWDIFGPPTSSSVTRPFGTSVIDGFDFDFESTVQNMVPFANQLRSLMTASSSSTGKQYILTAAPQCPYPDAADGSMLAGAVSFDAIFIQFYNNYCGVQSYTVGSSTQNNFNFDTWDNWAKTVSLNPDVKLLLGIPGNTGAGAGYETGTTLAAVIAYSKSFSSFGGVMIWDMSQAYSNSGFIDGVTNDLAAPASTTVGTTLTTSTTKLTTTATTTTGSTTPTNTGLVSQWNQCGGQGWTGGTQCIAPYVCTTLSVWYSMCE